jgi:hypothetical protein
LRYFWTKAAETPPCASALVMEPFTRKEDASRISRSA